jgi:hypothetical protein
MIGTQRFALQIRRSPGSNPLAAPPAATTRKAAAARNGVNVRLLITTRTYNGGLIVVPGCFVSTGPRYSADVKQIWQGRAAQVVTKYGEQAPMAAVCCNACRTCVTTNVVGLATGALAAAGYAAVRFARRVTRTP